MTQSPFVHDAAAIQALIDALPYFELHISLPVERWLNTSARSPEDVDLLPINRQYNEARVNEYLRLSNRRLASPVDLLIYLSRTAHRLVNPVVIWHEIDGQRWYFYAQHVDGMLRLDVDTHGLQHVGYGRYVGAITYLSAPVE